MIYKPTIKLCVLVIIVTISAFLITFVRFYIEEDNIRFQKRQNLENLKIVAMYCDKYYEEFQKWPVSVDDLSEKYSLIEENIEKLEYIGMSGFNPEDGYGYLFYRGDRIKEDDLHLFDDKVEIRFPFFTNIEWNNKSGQ